MKLSFSTRGWSHLSWEEWLAAGVDMRFEGVEIYNLPFIAALTEKSGPFHKYNIATTVRQMREKKLSIPCFDTSCDLSAENDGAIALVQQLIQLAKQAEVPYVSVVALQDKEDLVRSRLNELLPEAEAAGVTVLVKTSGIFADTARLRAMMDDFACDSLAALWDVQHPYRDCEESADTTIKNLGAYVKHVHLRDSDDKDTYNLIGEGTMPVADIMRALSSIDYDGFISLEWKTEWMEDLPDHEVIFTHFVNYMSRFEKTRGKKKVLYPNHDGTGQYVWKKDELINLTFSQVLDRMVEEFPDQYAFKYTTLDYVRTYEQFREDVDQFAKALISMGVKAGSKVSIWATNVPAWFITFWATTKIGAVLVTVNTAYKRHEA
ncbi:MAG: AMP-binding protein, partial [Lachnospiraceae bacterium]|nr:AMP-binding protein [Lachnospiraceae bacterium]